MDPIALSLLILTPITLFTLSPPPKKATSSNSNTTADSATNTRNASQLWKYLIPYYLSALADWLQGPHTYQIYASAGYSMRDISLLFVTGFFSSMIFGTFVGSMADRIGRKSVILFGYCLCYIMACVLIHFTDYFWLLIAGRIVSGVAASVLASAFESWMISEFGSNNKNNKSSSKKTLAYSMDEIFYWQMLGNGFMAILSGILAHFGLQFTNGRYTSAYDLSMICLILSVVPIALFWEENYGNQTQGMGSNFSEAFLCIFRKRSILCVGIAQSLFEAAMFIFVFLWSPTLDAAAGGNASYSHALVFSCFMVCAMLGSNTFSKARSAGIETEKILVLIMSVSLLALCVPIYFDNFYIVLCSFLLFEACVGVFWPTVGTLKSRYIPDGMRSTIMNYFRIPTNFAVVLTVLYSSQFERSVLFSVCCVLLSVAMVAALVVKKIASVEAQAVKKVK